MKQKKRKWLAIAVCIIMLLGMIPTAAFAQDGADGQGIDTYAPGGVAVVIQVAALVAVKVGT